MARGLLAWGLWSLWLLPALASSKPVVKVPVDAAAVVAAHVQAQVSSSRAELDGMLEEMRRVHDELVVVSKQASHGSAWEKQVAEMETQLSELEQMLEALEAEEASKTHASVSHEELKAEIERLKKEVTKIEGEEEHTHTVVGGDAAEGGDAAGAGSGSSSESTAGGASHGHGTAGGSEVDLSGGSDVLSGGAPQQARIDVDSEMPYGDLEPFGREDTAQELTEASIRESDEMVDQLERAEVAEEKRAVFRALTRLRGAAITSFDGVARSQTGNIDEYNKVNKWRATHPIHHLANEESDVSKWAFPDNADF